MTSQLTTNANSVYRPQSNESIVGLDVSGRDIVYVVIDSQRKIRPPDRIRGQGRNATQRLIKKLVRGHDRNFVFGIEPCTYSKVIIETLRQAGFKVATLATNTVRSQSGPPIKNDKRDARKLAEALLHGNYIPNDMAEDGIIALRQAVNERARLSRMIVKYKDRTHALKALADLDYAEDEIDALCEVAEFEAGRFQEPRSEALQAAYITTNDSINLTIDSLKTQIEGQDQVIRGILSDRLDFTEAAAVMTLLPRVSETTAAALIAGIRNPDLIGSVDHLRGFLKLVPWQYCSGRMNIVRKQKKSESERTLEHLLVVAATFFKSDRPPTFTAIQAGQFDPEILDLAKREYERIRNRQQHLKAKKKLIGHVRREVGFLIAVAAWRLWRHNRQLRRGLTPAA